MNAFYFGTGTHRLFGVYAPGVGHGPSTRAAVLCAPWGQEYLRSHRSMRQLGMQLRAAGFHVLQFDYYGTGDSAGDMVEASVKDWENDIGVALDELRDSCGAERVSLVGLRLGATFAARLAADRPHDIKELVLWDPVVSGNDYLRELRAMMSTPSTPDDPPYVNGFPLTPALEAEFTTLNLIALADQLPARTLAVSSAVPRAADAPLHIFGAALERRGPAASLEIINAPPAWLEHRSSGTALTPVAILQRITQWVS